MLIIVRHGNMCAVSDMMNASSVNLFVEMSVHHIITSPLNTRYEILSASQNPYAVCIIASRHWPHVMGLLWIRR